MRERDWFFSVVESASFYCNSGNRNSVNMARISILSSISNTILRFFILFKFCSSKISLIKSLSHSIRSPRFFNSTINVVVCIVYVHWVKPTIWTSPSKVFIVGCFVSPFPFSSPPFLPLSFRWIILSRSIPIGRLSLSVIQCVYPVAISIFTKYT